MKIHFRLVLIIMFFGILCSNAQGQSSDLLIGKWVFKNDRNIYKGKNEIEYGLFVMVDSILFNNSGKMDIHQRANSDESSFTHSIGRWEIENNSLILSDRKSAAGEPLPDVRLRISKLNKSTLILEFPIDPDDVMIHREVYKREK